MKLRQFSSCEILKYNSPKGEKRRRKRIIFKLEKGYSSKGEKGRKKRFMDLQLTLKERKKVVFVSQPKGAKGRQEKTYLSELLRGRRKDMRAQITKDKW